jgi:uncharacterized protein YjbI with pentapeptide repeats
VRFEVLNADEASFLDCRFSDVDADEGLLRRARLRSCCLDRLRLSSLDAASSGWTSVVVTGSRIGALVATAAELTRVTFRECRLDYLNLRGAQMQQVQFVDCRVGELDLATAALTDVRLLGCAVGRLALAGATLQRADLRDADLGAVDGIDGLSGAVISQAQLVRIAPALAEHLGIRVAPPD